MKRALVTGANRGIGLAIAKMLSEQGLEVLVGARDLKAGQKAAESIGGTALQLDVANQDSIAEAARQAGPVDVLVNNAGWTHRITTGKRPNVSPSLALTSA